MRALKIIGYSLICAALLFLFSMIGDLVKYLFSLGALYIGIQFFKKFEERGPRIAFVVTTILFYFIYTVFYAVYLTATGQGIPA
ncbi:MULTISPECIES: hypothetical protein [Paenibacillus]|uniref:hypothetical protein n=1 Tax=Paenibacillus TaxID=44249 RepID=UPI0022B8AA55|nr:hypothetical protein [Paenibacillus caseinilyticus]MCZ8520194.1 hypothetical protein [Paenibacillus caseinilyticus]